MKLIKPHFEILEQQSGLESIYKQIERAGRVCYSADTEILTNKGWIFFKNLTEDYKVLTYTPEDNTLDWDKPNVFCNEIDDNLVEINHSNIKLKVTKNHRIYQSVPEKREYSFLTASQIAGIDKIEKSRQTRFRLPKYFINSKRKNVNLPFKEISHTKLIKRGGFPKHEDEEITVTIPINKDFMVIAGSFISEGHTNHREKWHSGSNCQITQDENSQLYKDVITSLKNLNWNYRVDSDPRKPNIKWIKFGGGQCFVEFFDILFGKGSRNKHLPPWFRELPDDYLEILLKYLYLGDGSHTTTRKERYLSISKTLLDELQQVFILLGRNASYLYDNEISQKCSLEESTRDSWIIQRKKHVNITEKEKCKVYCTQTNTGIICVRYKGKTCWCGNCYKSEDKITEDSAKGFVDRMIKSGHGTVLEHGTVYLRTYSSYEDDFEIFEKYSKNAYSKVNAIGSIKGPSEDDTIDGCYITTNYRVLVENDWLEDLKHQCEPTKYHEKRVSVKFILDRSTANEFVRHRIFSFCQESQRYCNYSKDKYNSEITFCIPVWLNIPEGEAYWYEGLGYRVGADPTSKNLEKMLGFIEKGSKYNSFLRSLETSEKMYLQLIQENWKPEQARIVLPNATKTELVMTGFVSDWKSFFNLRCQKAAHPSARELAIPLKEEFNKRGYV